MRISCLFIFHIVFRGFPSPFPECIKRDFYTYFKGAYIQMDTQQLYFLNDIGKQNQKVFGIEAPHVHFALKNI